MKIIVDTNIVFSALLNSNSRLGSLLLNTRGGFDFYSCKYLQKEIQRHLPKLQAYAKLDASDLHELIQLVESRIFFIDEDILPLQIIDRAKKLVANVDFDDFAFVAMTDYLDGALWTGDKKLMTGLRQKGYNRFVTTEELWAISQQR